LNGASAAALSLREQASAWQARIAVFRLSELDGARIRLKYRADHPKMRLMPKRAAPAAYIWQYPDWPSLRWDAPTLLADLQTARLQQGRLLGQADAIGLPSLREVSRDLWVREAMATAAIEGEQLDLAAVRSSVHHRLGLADTGRPDRHVDGLVDVMQDAVEGYQAVLDEDRLCRWQAALFPGGTSGIRRITVGRYRDHTDPMQIISGRPGKEVVHYTAPPSAQVAAEMARFLAWFEATRPPADGEAPAHSNGLVRAALAHLWFETIHPFEDGNGRIGRAIVDMAIAQDLGAATRLFSLSRQMLESRARYYEALNQAQCGDLDVTNWVRWFAQAFTRSCLSSQSVVKQAMDKAGFWLRAAQHPLSERQRKVLSRLLEAGDGGFLGGMSAEKYSKIAGVSKATATRDLAQMREWALLVVEGVGKATRYAVQVEGWHQPPH
jgi:Fic family protein